MNYEEIKERFEGMTSAERLQTVNLMWPDLHPTLQVCISLTVVAVLGLAEAEAICRLTHYLSDTESQDAQPGP